MAEGMPVSLLFEWAEWFAIKAEAEKKAVEAAKRKPGRGRRR